MEHRDLYVLQKTWECINRKLEGSHDVLITVLVWCIIQPLSTAPILVFSWRLSQAKVEEPQTLTKQFKLPKPNQNLRLIMVSYGTQMLVSWVEVLFLMTCPPPQPSVDPVVLYTVPLFWLGRLHNDMSFIQIPVHNFSYDPTNSEWRQPGPMVGPSHCFASHK